CAWVLGSSSLCASALSFLFLLTFNFQLFNLFSASRPRYTLPSAMKLRPILLSALLLIPVFWHHHIEAGDLGSHVYNAWLAQLVQKGTAPGVYSVWQWKNILFDLLLLSLSNLFGIAAAEKIAVAFCALLFFWSVFALIAIATRRPPWLLTPFLAMLAYGYVFHMGFMNYYLSIALACLGLSLVWSGRPKLQLASLLLIPLMLLAHPLGAFWFLAAASYLLLWQHFPRWRIALPIVGFALVLAVRFFITHHSAYDVEWPEHPFYFFNGADQFVVFGERYRYISAIVFSLGLLMAGLDLRRAPRAASWWKDRLLLLELLVIAFCVTSLLPENLNFNQGTGWIGLIVSRLAIVTAIYALCLLGSLTPQKWHLAALSACALLFFVFLYQDTSLVARLEANAEKLTHNLPFGTRVLKTVAAPGDWRAPFIYHSIDRACIGHCFAFSNYEASTKQFRLRVREDSPVVVFDPDDSESMESGEYEVQPEDLPLKQIDQCDPANFTTLCLRDLSPHEINGRLSLRPFPN
ncbi:MAG: hypothetical protein WCE53_06720, partial [Candidatus Acidiferrum sp.]